MKLEVAFAELETPIEVEMPLGRYDRLSLAVGDHVGLVAQKFKIFTDDKPASGAAPAENRVAYSAANLT